MKKRLFCAFMSFVLCFSFSLCVYAQDTSHGVDKVDTEENLAFSLETAQAPEGAIAIAYNMIFGGDPYYYRVNGSILSANAGADYSTDGMIPAEVALSRGTSRKVIGNEERDLVADTSIYPYCAIVLLKVTHYDTLWNVDHISWGTGCMISSDTVLTAAHVLHDEDFGFPVSVEAFPGIHSDDLANAPCGSATGEEVALAAQYIPYVKEISDSYDWGVVRLNEDIGNSCGYLGIKFVTRNLRNQSITIAGYPAGWNHIGDDNPNDDTYYQYENTDVILSDTTENATPATYRHISYKVDTSSGQSGAPLWYNNKCIGVHNRADLDENYNWGFGITSQLYSFLVAYK